MPSGRESRADADDPVRRLPRVLRQRVESIRQRREGADSAARTRIRTEPSTGSRGATAGGATSKSRVRTSPRRDDSHRLDRPKAWPSRLSAVAANAAVGNTKTSDMSGRAISTDVVPGVTVVEAPARELRGVASVD